jgi:hypothetical protein
VCGTPDAARRGPLCVAYRDTRGRVQYLSAYPPSKDQPFLLDGLAEGSDPKITSDASGQIYVVRTDIMGNIQRNVWNNGWSQVQRLTGPEGFTEAPPAVGNSSAFSLDVLYRDADGNIHDVYQSGDQWAWQQVTGDSGIIKAPPAAGDPKTSEYGGGTEVCYRDTDGNIHNLETRLRKWIERPITGNPPRAVGDPHGTVYDGWLRILYRDNTGKIVHLMYDGKIWRWEHLPAPAEVVAAGDPVSAYYGNAWHIFYRESRGFIWHVYWYNNRWNGDQITGPGLSGGELAEGEPTAVALGSELHVLYRDIYDNLSDAYLTGAGWMSRVLI